MLHIVAWACIATLVIILAVYKAIKEENVARTYALCNDHKYQVSYARQMSPRKVTKQKNLQHGDKSSELCHRM